MKDSITSGIIATVVGGLILLAVERYLSSDDGAPPPSPIPSTLSEANVVLSGSNNTLKIISADATSAGLKNITISGSNLVREIALPKGQPLRVDIIGSNNEITIDRPVFSQVSVHEDGAHNQVRKAWW